MTANLLPCPFCEAAAAVENICGGGNCIKCTGCGAESAYCDDALTAIAAWNRRPDDWRDIETAPKDEPVLFWLEWADDIGTPEWRARTPVRASDRIFHGVRGSWSSVHKATHWRHHLAGPRAAP